MAKKISSDLAWFGINHQNLDAFLANKVHWKSKLSKYMVLIKVYLPFLYYSMKFFVEIWLIWPSIQNQAPRLFNNYVRTLKNSRNLNTSKQTIRWKWEDQILQEATTRMKYWHLKTQKRQTRTRNPYLKEDDPSHPFLFSVKDQNQKKGKHWLTNEQGDIR